MSKSGVVLVNLRKDWFGPDGSLYQARDNPHEFPAEYAEAGEAREQKEVKTTTVETVGGGELKSRYKILPSTAEIVESSKTVMVKQNTGGGQQLLVPSAVEDGATEVGGAINSDGQEDPAQSVAAAAKVAEKAGMDQVGGKPRESGPLPAGSKKQA